MSLKVCYTTVSKWKYKNFKGGNLWPSNVLRGDMVYILLKRLGNQSSKIFLCCLWESRQSPEIHITCFWPLPEVRDPGQLWEEASSSHQAEGAHPCPFSHLPFSCLPPHPLPAPLPLESLQELAYSEPWVALLPLKCLPRLISNQQSLAASGSLALTWVPSPANQKMWLFREDSVLSLHLLSVTASPLEGHLSMTILHRNAKLSGCLPWPWRSTPVYLWGLKRTTWHLLSYLCLDWEKEASSGEILS